MNLKIVHFIKNFSYSISSNIITLLISVLVTFIVPKFFGVKEYSMWQLYWFYMSYVGFFHFGWNDGIYLRFGGYDYVKLDKNQFYSQFIAQCVIEGLIATAIIFISKEVVINPDKNIILYATAVGLIFTNIRYFFLYILQATNRLMEYAQITILDRVLFFALCCTLIFCFDIKQYQYLIYADLFSRLISLLYGIYTCKDIFVHSRIVRGVVKEAVHNIRVGSPLMIANLASMMIVGVVRLGIEQAWDVEVFGKVSLMVSISNIFIVFIGAISIVLYPLMCRTSKDELREFMDNFNIVFSILLFSILFLYYPLKIFLELWLPNYKESLSYIALLFPMCIYEGKMSLLFSTYLKVLRKEKILMSINGIAAGVGVITTFLTTVVFKNLNLAVISILFLIALRCILCEIYVSIFFNINSKKDIIWSLFLTILFLICNEKELMPLENFVIYGIGYAAFGVMNYKSVKESILNIKNIIREGDKQ